MKNVFLCFKQISFEIRIEISNYILKCIVYRRCLSLYDEWIQKCSECIFNEIKHVSRFGGFDQRYYRYHYNLFNFGSNNNEMTGNLHEICSVEGEDPVFDYSCSELVFTATALCKDVDDKICFWLADNRGKTVTAKHIESIIHRCLDPYCNDDTSRNWDDVSDVLVLDALEVFGNETIHQRRIRN